MTILTMTILTMTIHAMTYLPSYHEYTYSMTNNSP